MKKLLAIIAVLFLSATPKQEREFTFRFTQAETEIIFNALGELPSKKVEVIRYKMMTAVQAQNDTTKRK